MAIFLKKGKYDFTKGNVHHLVFNFLVTYAKVFQIAHEYLHEHYMYLVYTNGLMYTTWTIGRLGLRF